jgi:hypothetical protein
LVPRALRAWCLVRQVLEAEETLWIGLCGCVDERGWYSEFAQLIWPEGQPWLRAAVGWIENTQINQCSVLFPVRWPICVVDGYD